MLYSHLDGKHVVFGRVIGGRSVARMIEEGPTQNDTPNEETIIYDCGELAEGEDDGIPVNPSADPYEDYPSDDENDVHEVCLHFRR